MITFFSSIGYKIAGNFQFNIKHTTEHILLFFIW